MIDSSLVVAFMRRAQVGHLLRGFLGLRVSTNHPTPALLPSAMGTRHHEIRVDDCTPELLEHLVWHTSMNR